ncbi:MAG TPA: hypothetical protein VIU29_03375 [Candidatus Deferrimicrobiaceae bacterium]
MKRLASIIVALPIVLLFGGNNFAGEGTPVPKMQPNVGFDKLRPLVGKWRGTSNEGKAVKVSYALVSDGSALEEKIDEGSDHEMVTVYHPDGDSLMMTHYCAAHNQPRMRAKTVSPESRTLSFDFVDATNLPSPDAMHMHKLVVTLQDKDHLVQEWTWTSKEKEGTVVLRLERTK